MASKHTDNQIQLLQQERDSFVAYEQRIIQGKKFVVQINLLVSF